MPKHRLGKDLWQHIRFIIWSRDNGLCTHCHNPVSLNEFHCDHIISGKFAGNKLNELRTLCRKCHVLRADSRHRGMIASALRDGIIGPDWRCKVWDG